MILSSTETQTQFIHHHCSRSSNPDHLRRNYLFSSLPSETRKKSSTRGLLLLPVLLDEMSIFIKRHGVMLRGSHRCVRTHVIETARSCSHPPQCVRIHSSVLSDRTDVSLHTILFDLHRSVSSSLLSHPYSPFDAINLITPDPKVADSTLDTDRC
jgi:hypothetical protein